MSSILLVDDEPATQFGYTRFLSHAGYEIQSAATLAEAREKISERPYDALLLDLNLPDGNGIDWIPHVRGAHGSMAIVVITGAGNIAIAVEAMRRGADNFLTKPVNMQDLDVYLKKSLEVSRLRRHQSLHQRLNRRRKPYFGSGPAITETLELARVASENDSVTLLQGETGTGKGVLARWIHEHGNRGAGAYVEVNCSSLGGDLLGSELFGHVKGAFTSAIKDRAGLLEAADGGTIFLDEIGDMDPGVQAQLLKTIEEKSYRRIGDDRMRRSDFRLICATNRDLMKQVQDRSFREDLYYRICVFPIVVPPLRQRLEDFAGLVSHIMRELGAGDRGSLPGEVLDALTRYQWPGNIRELRNMLERALLLSRGKTISISHFPGIAPADDTIPAVISPGPSAAQTPAGDRMDGAEDNWNLETAEFAMIRRALDHFDGDKVRASKALGISLASMYRKLAVLDQRDSAKTEGS